MDCVNVWECCDGAEDGLQVGRKKRQREREGKRGKEEGQGRGLLETKKSKPCFPSKKCINPRAWLYFHKNLTIPPSS